ncbi:hypothetical protein AB3R30_18850 [Leptolyngbyaceae cyanobacterium UHCC 1019]
MQDLLTAAATGVEIFTALYVVFNFVPYAWKRSGEKAEKQPPATAPTPESPILDWEAKLEAELALEPELEPEPLEIRPRRRRTAALAITPSALRVEEVPALPGTIRELRKLCTQRGIKGAGRFSKAQCLAALE